MISVIVPNYNHFQFLPQRLETIFNQTFQNFEVILLDDCSTDGSWEYLKQFENHPKVSHCIRNNSNSGSPFRQWKKGVELAKYEWIWIAESDDFSDCNFLEKLVDHIDIDVSIIFSKSLLVDDNGLPLYFNGVKRENKLYDLGENFFKMNGVGFIKEFLVYRNYLLNASAVLFKKPKKFPFEILSMKFSGDWLFWLTILKNGNVVYLSSPKNFFRFHQGSTRIILDEKTEQRKFKEYFDCIMLGKNISKKCMHILFLDSNFTEIVEEYFKLRFKYGRLRFHSLFPKIPFFLYRLYYKFLIQSFKGKL